MLREDFIALMEQSGIIKAAYELHYALKSLLRLLKDNAIPPRLINIYLETADKYLASVQEKLDEVKKRWSETTEDKFISYKKD